MSTTFAEMENRVLRGVESVGNIIFGTSETADACNDGIQETVNIIKTIFPEFFITSADIAFTATDTEKELPSGFDGLKLCEDASKNKVSITVLRHKNFTQVAGEYFIYYDSSDSKWYLARKNTGKAETLTVWYHSALALFAHGSTSTIDVLTEPGIRYAQSVAELNLLSNRGRRNRRKEVNENKRKLDLIQHISSLIGDAEEETVVYDG